jgi:hypothetical protein
MESQTEQTEKGFKFNYSQKEQAIKELQKEQLFKELNIKVYEND